jgi:hypothetical protein
MRARILSGFFCNLLLCVPAAIPSQNGSNPLNTWTVTIVLPPRLMAGHPATLAVLGVDGKLAPGVTVNLSDGDKVMTDRTGRALFTAPATGDYLLASASGSAAATLIDPAEGTSEPSNVTLPTIVSVRDRFWICAGSLQGRADANTVQIGDNPALVLAASPECIVVLAGPHAKPGTTSLSLETPGVRWTASTTLVSLEFDAPNPALLPGQKGQLTVHARGSDEKLRIVVSNRTPGVLRFLQGDSRELVTSGGADNGVGIPVKAVTSGDFSFSARLLDSPSASVAARYLLAAETVAPGDLRGAAKSLAGELEHHPRDTERVRADVQRIIRKTIEGDFRTLLEAAQASL